MKSSLGRILKGDISEEDEAALLGQMKSKMRSACGFLVRVVRALEEEFGREAVHEAVRRRIQRVVPRPGDELKTPQEDLAEYLERLEHGCAGSHEWRRVEEGADRVAYEFTRCMWAEIFQELDATDIGAWICQGDDPAVRSYNPRLRCRLTKTLMEGDDLCNHVFHVAPEGEA